MYVGYIDSNKVYLRVFFCVHFYEGSGLQFVYLALILTVIFQIYRFFKYFKSVIFQIFFNRYFSNISNPLNSTPEKALPPIINDPAFINLLKCQFMKAGLQPIMLDAL
jgi:hypothetical protein